MKAIILAAGFGNRMRPLTQTTHKTLLQIGGRTVIQWIVDALLGFDITDLTVVTGYRAAELEEHLSIAYPQLDIKYVHNERYAQTNNIYSMALAFETMSIDDDVIVIESDLIFDPVVIGRLLSSRHSNVALVDHYRKGMDGTVVTIGDDDVITNVIPPHLQGTDFNFDDKYKTLNIYRFSKAFCESSFNRLLTYYARVIDDNCYYELILGIIIYMQREVVHAEVIDGDRWAEIDDPNDLDMARYLFETSRRKEILDQSFGGYWNYEALDFCFIRNMYFPTGAVLAELRNNLPTLVHNYGSGQTILTRKLAYYLFCREDRLIVLNGLSQVYPILKRYFEGQEVLRPEPTFGEYARTFPNSTSYGDAIGLDLEEIRDRAQHCDVVVFVNPNNPTGSTLPAELVFEFASQHRDKTVLVDESFIDFTGSCSMLSLLEAQQLTNVIVLKSLSKSLGVPGIRLGYVYTANPKFNQYLCGEIPVWNINSVAENFLEILLKHRTDVQSSFGKTMADRECFASQLEELPIVDRVYPSGGNFLLVALRCSRVSTENLVRRLLSEHGIYVKDVSSRFPGRGSYLRLAVRWPAENERFVKLFSSTAAETSYWGAKAVATA